MSWDRHYSKLEKLLVEILEETDSALTLNEIVKKIEEKHPGTFSGKTPSNSLYSVIYRRENRRKQRGHEPLLKTVKEGRSVYYTLNETLTNKAGKEIIQDE